MIGAMVVVGAALAYFVIAASGVIGPVVSPTPNNGQAATQFGPVQFTVQVVDVARAAGRVEIKVVFRNKSQSQQRADPADFLLKSGSQRLHAEFGPGCADWGRVDLYPTGDTAAQPRRDADATGVGPTWGPTVLCFRDPGPGSALTLAWTPDVSFALFGQETDIPVR